MKFLITGDWHIRQNAPERRLDEYWATARKKITFILDLAKKEVCDFILQPGDFFDSHRANDFLKRYMIKKFMWTKTRAISVFGQHDLRYHSSDVRNTPLAILSAAGVVKIVSNREPLDLEGYLGGGRTDIYGASWYEDIPKEVKRKDAFNILIMHKMVIANEKVWEGQEDYQLGNILLKTLPFNLIVSGDNHKHFTIIGKSKQLFNCGSLLRSSIDQIDHTPVVYIYDTERDHIEQHFVPIEPFEQVFDMQKVEAKKEQDKKMEAFVSRLTGEAELEGMNFIKNMASYCKINKEEIDDATQEIIEEVME